MNNPVNYNIIVLLFLGLNVSDWFYGICSSKAPLINQLGIIIFHKSKVFKMKKRHYVAFSVPAGLFLHSIGRRVDIIKFVTT